MNPASHSHGHRRRSRQGRLQKVMLFLLVGLVIALVVGLIWFLSNPKLSTVD